MAKSTPKTKKTKSDAKPAKPAKPVKAVAKAMAKSAVKPRAKAPVKPRGTRKPAAAAASPVKRPRRGVVSVDNQLRNFAIEAARLANESHLTDVLLLDVRGLSQVTDFIVIGTGVSNRMIQSVGESIAELAEKSGIIRLGREVDGSTRWYIIDLGAVMIHLFDGATRAHYDIEMLWGDAPRIRWRRTPGAKADAEVEIEE
jgi:ribosome-associated protein